MRLVAPRCRGTITSLGGSNLGAIHVALGKRSSGVVRAGLRCTLWFQKRPSLHVVAVVVAWTGTQAFVLGCASEINGGDSETDDGAATGGTAGSGGTTGGSASGAGGTSGASSACVSVCDRAQDCPDAETRDCELECARTIRDGTHYGCPYELSDWFTCRAGISDICAATSADPCASENAALVWCLGHGPSAGCMETATSETTCTDLCWRQEMCSGVRVDCPSRCGEEAANMAAMGCWTVYRSYLDCSATCRDFCARSERDCPVTFAALDDCVTSYCSTNPSEPGCTDV
jgi:hypothetical protein